jgi:hypothetical protein
MFTINNTRMVDPAATFFVQQKVLTPCESPSHTWHKLECEELKSGMRSTQRRLLSDSMKIVNEEEFKIVLSPESMMCQQGATH